MNSKTKTALAIGVLAASIALYFRSHRPVTSEVRQPDPQPGYLVMGKKFIDHEGGYSIQYDLLGPEGEAIVECRSPRTDGTGCEKFDPNQTYPLSKDASGRFLTDKSGDIRLVIESEGLWPDQKTSVDEADPNPNND